MKVLYITYENVFRTPILQAQVLGAVKKINKNFNVSFEITSAVKESEADEIYRLNKLNTELPAGIKVIEFKKTLPHNQSIHSFIKDIIPILRKTIKISKESDIIHCRSYGGAFIGYITHLFTGKPFIFDMRGVLPEETVLAGKITKESFKYKALKFAEKLLIKKSSFVFTVSERFSNYIKGHFHKDSVMSISNPTDFALYENEKNNDVIKFVYSGSLMPWHCGELAVKYFQKISERYGSRVYMFFCTNMIAESKALFENYNISPELYSVQNLTFNDMRKINSESHFGFCFTRPSFITSICCPVKFGEYIASNQFIITNEGVGDLTEIIKEYKNGISLKNPFDIDKNIEQICSQIDLLLEGKPVEDYRKNVPYMDWYIMSEKIFSVYTKLCKS